MTRPFIIPLSGFLEQILAYTADRAFEIFGKIRKGGAGSDAQFGSAELLIIFPSAYAAYVFHL